MDIGRTIKKLREEKSISQKDLAKMAGISYSTLTKIETGVIISPKIEKLILLAKALEVKIDDLIYPIKSDN